MSTNYRVWPEEELDGFWGWCGDVNTDAGFSSADIALVQITSFLNSLFIGNCSLFFASSQLRPVNLFGLLAY